MWGAGWNMGRGRSTRVWVGGPGAMALAKPRGPAVRHNQMCKQLAAGAEAFEVDWEARDGGGAWSGVATKLCARRPSARAVGQATSANAPKTQQSTGTAGPGKGGGRLDRATGVCPASPRVLAAAAAAGCCGCLTSDTTHVGYERVAPALTRNACGGCRYKRWGVTLPARGRLKLAHRARQQHAPDRQAARRLAAVAARDARHVRPLARAAAARAGAVSARRHAPRRRAQCTRTEQLPARGGCDCGDKWLARLLIKAIQCPNELCHRVAVERAGRLCTPRDERLERRPRRAARQRGERPREARQRLRRQPRLPQLQLRLRPLLVAGAKTVLDALLLVLRAQQRVQHGHALVEPVGRRPVLHEREAPEQRHQRGRREAGQQLLGRRERAVHPLLGRLLLQHGARPQHVGDAAVDRVCEGERG